MRARCRTITSTAAGVPRRRRLPLEREVRHRCLRRLPIHAGRCWRLGNTQINSALFGGYASCSADGGFTADAVVGGGYNGYRVRGIDFGTVDRSQSQPSGGQFSAALNPGYDWQAGKFTFGPITGGNTPTRALPALPENGADSLDLAVGQQNVNSLRTTLGGRVAYTWNGGPSQISLYPEVRMFWQHEFLNKPANISSSLDWEIGPDLRL